MAAGERPALHWVLLSIVFAALQSGVTYYLQEYHTTSSREWCTKQWHQIDCKDPDVPSRERDNGTDLEIILPSYGQTGTTSVTQALRDLGYRAYHADDYSIFQKQLMFDTPNYKSWARGVTRCRMQAMALEPVTDVIPMALAMSPKAKFIMTWRSYPSWRKSTTATRVKEIRWGIIGIALMKGNRLLPWVEMWDGIFGNIRYMRMKGQVFPTDFPIAAYIYRVECNGYAWPATHYKDRGTFKSKADEEAYLGHQNEIRSLVPKERLLEFDVKTHSWGDLERFLNISTGRLGTPFPHPRDKEQRTNEVVMEKNFKNTRWALLCFCAMHAANIFVVGMAMRLALVLLALLSWLVKLVDWPLEGTEEHLSAALESSPLVVVLDGIEPKQTAELAAALAAVGVGALALPMGEEGAVDALQQLAAAPALQGTAIGGRAEDCRCGAAQEVYRVRGHFVLSRFADRSVLRRARSLGLASLAGASTPSEMLAALRAGAAGVVVAPEFVPPSGLRWCRSLLPRATHVLAWGVVEPQALAEYWAAGITGVVVGGASLLRPGEPTSEAAVRAEALSRACLIARRARESAPPPSL